jgi:hypothetical protein
MARHLRALVMAVPPVALLLLPTALFAAGPRQDASLEAAREFLKTHNYVRGRGLHVVPGVFELVDLLRRPPLSSVHRRLVETGFGINMLDGRPVGLFTVQEPGFSVGVFGCVACHSGKAAGQVYVGLGNKTVDVGTIGRTVLRFEKPYRWTRPLREPSKTAVVDRAFAFMRKLTHPRITNVTKGLVSINHVNVWFYELAGGSVPATVPRGGTQVAPRGGVKDQATSEGLFYDGLGRAGSIGWLALPELAAGQLPEVIRDDFPRIEKLWDVITKLEPPRYPFAVDAAGAGRGRAVYEQSCLKCHGSYRRDAEGMPLHEPPIFNTIEEVGTDTDRLDATTADLKQRIASSPLSDLIQAADRPRGYFATRLDGVWANFPYLHNGSVPTLADLLSKPAARPRVWSLERPGERDRFDTGRVGYTVPPAGSRELRALERRARRGERDVYSVDREGHANRGHEFGTDLGPADKRDLIEYLKTL